MKRLSATLLSLACLAGPAAAQQAAVTTTPSEIDEALAAAAAKAARSVVGVLVERSAYGPRPLSTLEKRGLGVTGAYDPRYFSRPEGPSSGVVVAPGLVATSVWNLEGEGAVTVIATDGTKLPARRVGRDESLRVSFLKVEGLKTPPLQPSGLSLQVGRTLLLVARGDSGRPVVTRGIISGLARLRGDAFTHSAKTSYDNVGGALVDLHGDLFGVSVRHSDRARQGQSSGVGFGARIDRIEPNLDAVASGEVIPPRPTAFLGISSDVRFAEQGVLIQRIVDGTAAKAVGLQPGDIIKIFNSVELMDFNHLVEEIQKLEVGAEIIITVKRDDKELDFQVKLGKRPEDS